MSNKLRWSKFFWSDWSDDPALALCSHAAQGIWMRLLCIAAQGTPYGHVTINGNPPSVRELARLMRPPMRPRDMQRAIDQLVDQGVAKLSPTGAIFCPRMNQDLTISRLRSDAAHARWNKARSADLHMQTDGFAMHLEGEADTQDAHAERRARARAYASERPAFKCGFGASAAADMQGTTDHAETANPPPGGATVVPIARGPNRS